MNYWKMHIHTHIHSFSLSLTFTHYNYIVLKIDTDFFHEKHYQNWLLKDDSAFTRIGTS